jgi:hypothetical protein
MMARDPNNYRQLMGLLIQKQADLLVQQNAIDAALKLIDGALKLNPPLLSNYLSDLTDLQTKLRVRAGRTSTTTQNS